MQEKFNTTTKLKVLRPVGKEWPITSEFARKRLINGKLDIHAGTDIACKVGTPIKAVADGMIIRSGWENPSNPRQGFGLRVMQRALIDGAEYLIWYGHQSKPIVEEKDLVKAGDVIGLSGNTGHIVAAPGKDGAHLCLRFRRVDTNEFYGPEFYDTDPA